MFSHPHFVCVPALALGLLLGGCEDRSAPAGTVTTNAPGVSAPALPEASLPGPRLPPRGAAPVPPPPVTAGTPSDRDPSADPGVAVFAGFRAPKPATWRWYPPESSMRAANYVVPAASGEEQAHVVVFHGIGGGVDMNIERWIGQFRAEDGGPVIPEMTRFEVNGLPVTVVELFGAYRGMGAPDFASDHLFLAAIVGTSRGDLQVRLVGPRATVETQREAFMEMIRGLRPAE